MQNLWDFKLLNTDSLGLSPKEILEEQAEYFNDESEFVKIDVKAEYGNKYIGNDIAYHFNIVDKDYHAACELFTISHDIDIHEIHIWIPIKWVDDFLEKCPTLKFGNGYFIVPDVDWLKNVLKELFRFKPILDIIKNYIYIFQSRKEY